MIWRILQKETYVLQKSDKLSIKGQVFYLGFVSQNWYFISIHIILEKTNTESFVGKIQILIIECSFLSHTGWLIKS